MTPKTGSNTNLAKEAAGVEQRVDLLFETSWEVCNKVGGIYAVLSTKARVLGEQFGDKLIFVGPDLWTAENPSPYFKERKTMLRGASAKLQLPWGITVRTGRWNVPGSPQVILVNPGDTRSHINEVYGLMWQRFGVDSLHAYGDYNESCEFAVASAIVIDAITAFLKADPARVIAHFDEWTTGMGLLYLETKSPKISTIFTTHATSIGRSICGNGKELYTYFYGYNGDEMAAELNMQSKHSLEKKAAMQADCFTTVSSVTARECAQLLNRKVDVVTPNGFEPDFVPKTVKYNRLRKDGRSRLLKIASALTGRAYDDSAFLIATSGRHEYRNKGLDLFLDSIALLNDKIPMGRDAIAFILVPGWVDRPRPDLTEALADDRMTGLDRDYITHILHNDDQDEVPNRIRQLEADGKLDNVKVIYVPCYLNGNDGIVNISYYDLLPAFDQTIFPSYYEPWGYTPQESVAFGVPTVTDDKAGFGQWVLDNFANGISNCGVDVVKRDDSSYLQTRDDIVAATLAYVDADANARQHARNMAFLTAAKTDWKYFIKNYDEAFAFALDHNNRK